SHARCARGCARPSGSARTGTARSGPTGKPGRADPRRVWCTIRACRCMGISPPRLIVAEGLRSATEYLTARVVDNPRADAERLRARALGRERIELYTQHDRPLTEAERSAARELVQRRGRREPLAYVLGDWDFRKLTLKTDRRALVPRPETEIV